MKGYEGAGRTWSWASRSSRERFCKEGLSVLALLVLLAHANWARARVAMSSSAAARVRRSWRRPIATRVEGVGWGEVRLSAGVMTAGKGGRVRCVRCVRDGLWGGSEAGRELVGFGRRINTPRPGLVGLSLVLGLWSNAETGLPIPGVWFPHHGWLCVSQFQLQLRLHGLSSRVFVVHWFPGTASSFQFPAVADPKRRVTLCHLSKYPCHTPRQKFQFDV